MIDPASVAIVARFPPVSCAAFAGNGSEAAETGWVTLEPSVRKSPAFVVTNGVKSPDPFCPAIWVDIVGPVAALVPIDGLVAVIDPDTGMGL